MVTCICDIGGEEVWEVEVLPNAEPICFSPAETPTFLFLWHRWERSMGDASVDRAHC